MPGWDNGVHRIDGLALGFDLAIYDMHDDCGRWLHLDLNLLKVNVEISRYLGPTRDPYTDDDKIIVVRPDELCASCAGTLSGRAADSKSDGGGFESPPALRPKKEESVEHT